ncbi:hypothetical protein TruAng_002577 [Truncatella angustata]|nr:hypothetical protein TruAng_002577 [Truncatella angustata]
MQPGYRQPYQQQPAPQRTPHAANPRRGGIGEYMLPSDLCFFMVMHKEGRDLASGRVSGAAASGQKSTTDCGYDTCAYLSPSPSPSAIRRPMMSAGPGHHQVPMTQAQVAQQQQQQAMQVEMAKRRSKKPTDKNLPDGVDDCTIGDVAARYRQLRDFERTLDATMTRKRLDIVDSVNRSVKRYKTLRIWVTNTAEDQVWQANALNNDSFDFSSNTEPTYKVKIQGRLLDDDDDLDKDDEADDEEKEQEQNGDKMDENSDSSTKTATSHSHRFSHFFKSLTVDFPVSRKGVDQPVEWKKPERAGNSQNLPAAADFDELTFKRSGDENLNITINLFRHEEPERYALSPEMQEVLDEPSATRQEVVMAVWDYIKYFGLQEDEEKRNFRCDDILKKALGGIESGVIPSLQSYITQALKPLPPVKLPYTIRVDEDFHKDPQPTVYDVRVSVESPLREKMSTFLSNPGYASMLKEVATQDDQLATLVQAIHVSKSKHAFLTALSEDPTNFVKNWLSSQKRDLEIVMGEAIRGGSEDASGDEWRKGGPDSVWGTVNAKESVSMMLAKQPQHVQR